jgi:hypothetical protein
MDPAPYSATFVIDLQDANKKTVILLIAVIFGGTHLHTFPKIKSHKEVTQQ